MGDTESQAETDRSVSGIGPRDVAGGKEGSDRRRDGSQEDNRIGPSPERPHRSNGTTGGYYWFPTPGAGGISWSVVTCHDLHCKPDAGHDEELWSKLIDRLAPLWAKDARLLRRHLGLSYTGLPRGRVTRPERMFLILHGNDSPDPGWKSIVSESFSLTGGRVKFLFDEHETMIPGHSRAVEVSLGFRLYRAER